MSTDLFKQVDKGVKRAFVQEDGEDAPSLVSDASQIARLIEELVSERFPEPALIAEGREKNWRTVVNEEHPWLIESVVRSALTEEQFKYRLMAALAAKNPGTFLHGLEYREYNGTWKPVSISIKQDKVVKMDVKRERPHGGISGVEAEWNPDAPPPADFVGVNKATVRWVIEWMDMSGSPWIKRDVHGREAQKLDVNVDNSGVGEALAKSVDRMTAALTGVAGPTPVAPSGSSAPSVPSGKK